MKKVRGCEPYEYKGTEYLLVKTTDDWIYRFKRPAEGDHPFEFEKKQRPDGSWSHSNDRLPDNVVEFMNRTFDATNLHARPSSLRNGDY